MRDTWVLLAEVVSDLAPTLTDADRSDYSRLATAISHALNVAEQMPTTFDVHTRGLVVDKLSEAGHWSVEMLRATGGANRS